MVACYRNNITVHKSPPLKPQSPQLDKKPRGGLSGPKVRRPPDFSCQALAEGLKENSTLMNLNLQRNEIGPEGAKAWCLVEDGVERKGAARFHRKNQDMQPVESEVVLKGMQIAALLISHERQVCGNM